MQTPINGIDAAEFTTFMRAYQDMVFSTAARLTGSDVHAEDIAQEVFLRAYEHFRELRSSTTAGGWLKTVTVNLALNFLTRYKKRWRLFSEMASGGGSGTSSGGGFGEAIALGSAQQTPDTLLTELDAEERRKLLDTALRCLPQQQRIVLALYHFEELPYQEIADKLQCSLTKVKTDIHRARAALLALLEHGGATKQSLEIES